MAEIEQRFVNTFPTSVTRRLLLGGWRSQTEELSSIVQIDCEWIDGSFVTTKRDPRDIDMTIFILMESWRKLDNASRQKVASLTQGPEPKIRFGCDSYLVLVPEDGDSLEATYLLWRGYWDRQWSRGRTGSPKGYIEIRDLR